MVRWHSLAGLLLLASCAAPPAAREDPVQARIRELIEDWKRAPLRRAPHRPDPIPGNGWVPLELALQRIARIPEADWTPFPIFQAPPGRPDLEKMRAFVAREGRMFRDLQAAWDSGGFDRDAGVDRWSWGEEHRDFRRICALLAELAVHRIPAPGTPWILLGLGACNDFGAGCTPSERLAVADSIAILCWALRPGLATGDYDGPVLQQLDAELTEARIWLRENRAPVMIALDLLSRVESDPGRCGTAESPLTRWIGRVRTRIAWAGNSEIAGWLWDVVDSETDDFPPDIQASLRRTMAMAQLHLDLGRFPESLQVGVAVARFRVAKGSFPVRLEALVPDFISPADSAMVARNQKRYQLEGRNCRIQGFGPRGPALGWRWNNPAWEWSPDGGDLRIGVPVGTR